MNVLRYCNLDESLQGEEGLVCQSALERLCKTKELDYMSYIVLRLFENTEVHIAPAFSLSLSFMLSSCSTYLWNHTLIPSYNMLHAGISGRSETIQNRTYI